MSGYLDILNIGKGHVHLSFEEDNPEDVAMAERAVTDMLKRGYLLVRVNDQGVEEKVEGFDPQTKCYIVKGPAGDEQVSLKEGKVTAVDMAGGG